MKFSIEAVPIYPLKQTLEIAKTADENGFYGFWFADEIYFKDPWITMAICSMMTKNMVLGPCVTHVYLRDPTLIAQALGTLDELSNGRAVCGISVGLPLMLQQYHIGLEGTKPVKRLREAVEVIRKMLTEQQITYDGEFFKYSGLSSAAKKLGKLPIYIGGMRGPLTFRLAGEIGDGVMLCYGHSHQYLKYVIEEVEKGAKTAKRDLKEFDVACGDLFCTSKDSDAAKEAAKTLVGRIISLLPNLQLAKHGIQPDDVTEIRKAFFAGDISKVIDLTTMDLVEKLSISGCPEECIDKIEDLEANGVKHLLTLILDAELIRHLTRRKIPSLPKYTEMIKLISREIIPHFQ